MTTINQPVLGEQPKKELKGVAGWLYLVAFGQIVGPIVQVLLAVGYFRQPDFWDAFEVYPVMAIGEIIMNLGMIAFMLWTTYNFFTKSRRWPTLFLIELWLFPVMLIVDSAWVVAMINLPAVTIFKALFGTTKDIQDFVRTMIVALIWTPYVLKSRRVKNTFVN